jgi:hypothetical protein
MASLAFILLQIEPFETLPRLNRVDWLGVAFLFAGLSLLIILHYRNPSAISSMIMRSIRETSKKLYFALPAIDSLDKLLFTTIFIISGAFCVHFLLSDLLSGIALFVAYLFPFLLMLFLFMPLRFIGFVSGNTKVISQIVQSQMPIVYLAGLMLLLIGMLLFLQIELGVYWRWVFGVLVLVNLLWLHVRVIRDLIQHQISMFYIFMYFCTLEILPIF